MGLLTELLVPLAPVTNELAQLSKPVLYIVLFAAFIVTSVVWNVLKQLLFKDSSKPPVVFHWVPWFGSTVVYGMDPYAFFFDCQKKVSLRALDGIERVAD